MLGGAVTFNQDRSEQPRLLVANPFEHANASIPRGGEESDDVDRTAAPKPDPDFPRDVALVLDPDLDCVANVVV